MEKTQRNPRRHKPFSFGAFPRKREKAYCLLVKKNEIMKSCVIGGMKKTTYNNGKCEYNPILKQRLIIKRTPEETQYGRLWAEIEIPKLLQRGDKQ
jgi:hypothetical protein